MVYEDLMDVFLEAFEAAQAPAADLLIEIFADPIRSDWFVPAPSRSARSER